jgi:2-oxoisovalerate dehydrogenase E2 component (dihydrolipoyl transacylase)
VPERDFRLPDLGEGLTDAEVVRWLVTEGDSISLNQPIVEVETAKAMVEIPAPYAGTITRLHAKEGDSVEVGSPLISVDTGEAAGGNGPVPSVEGEGAPAEEAQQQAHLVGPGERPQTRRRRAGARGAPAGAQRGGEPGGNGGAATAPPSAPAPTAAATSAAAAAPAPAPAAQEPAAPAPAARPMATPPVRKYAKDRGIDLAGLEGTGKDGRITREDVDRALTAPEPEPLEAPAAAAMARPSRDRVERTIAVTGTRKQIAAAMVASKFSIPHVTEFLTADATNLMALRERLKALPAAADARVTPLAIVARAVCAAVRQYPLMNSSWDEQSGQIVVKEYVNLGIATDTETGLLVPNVKDADVLGILDLAREIARVTDLARQRKAGVADLTGGTITITNVGGFGVETGTPIINKPECAIIATGTIAQRPWVVDGELAVRQVMTTSVSFDHRIVDGAYAAKFLATLRDLLEDPVLLAV